MNLRSTSKRALRPRIIAFCSHRGGTGKTTASLNIGALMAASGRQVLLIDFDLESPGLTPISFETGKVNKIEWFPSSGVVDFLVDYLNKKKGTWTQFLRSTPLFQWPLPEGLGIQGVKGSLSFLPAGHGDARIYRQNLQELNRLLGQPALGPPEGASASAHELARRAAEVWRQFTGLRDALDGLYPYDYVLIDCRSGLYWASAFASQYLADHVVFFTGLTQQHLTGTVEGVLWLLQHAEFGRRPERSRPGDRRVPGKLILVASPIPEHQYKAVTERIAALEKRVAAAVGSEKVRDLVASTLEFEPGLALGTQSDPGDTLGAQDSPEENLDTRDNSRDTLVAQRARQYVGGMIPADPNMLLVDEIVVGKPEYRDCQLNYSYYSLHNLLRIHCDDHVGTWMARGDEAWKESDYKVASQSLGSVKGLLYLLNPQMGVGKTEYHTLLSTWVSRMKPMIPAELAQAQELVNYVVTDYPEKGKYEPLWLWARVKTFQNPREAERTWSAVEKLASQAGHVEDLLRIRLESHMGHDKWGMGVFPGALREALDRDTLVRTLEAQRRRGDIWGSAITLHALAELDRQDNNFDTARADLEQARAIHEGIDRWHLSTTVHSIGLLRRLLGDYIVARQELEAALKMKEELQDEHGASIVQHSLAELSRLQGREGESRERCTIALKTAQRLDERRGVGVINITLSEMHRARAKYPAAKGAMEKELKAATEAGDGHGERVARLYLAAIACQADRDRSLDTKVDGLMWAREEVNRDGILESSFRADILLAGILLARGDFKGAEEVCTHMALGAEKAGLRGLDADAQSLLAIALDSQGRQTEASERANSAARYYAEQEVETALAKRVADIVKRQSV